MLVAERNAKSSRADQAQRGDFRVLDPLDVSGLRGDLGFVSYQAAAFDEPRPRAHRRAHVKSETLSRISDLADLGRFRLSWSHYALLVRTDPGTPEYSTNRGAACLVMRQQIEERRKALNR
jgi:hypothetical protein